MTLNNQRSKVAHIHMTYNSPRVTNFSPFHSTDSRFRVTDHFETSAPNYSKMTLNNKRLNVFNIHVTSTPGPQISFRLALEPGVSELQAILRQVRRMTQNTKRSKVPHIHITTTPEFQITLRFALRPAVFELQTILRLVHRMTPKKTFNGKRLKVPHIM